MVDHPNRFAWYELLTTDTAAAKAFYSNVLGWQACDASTPEFGYDLFTTQDCPVTGLMELPEQGRRQGATPRWVGYVAVENVEAAAERLKRLGGTVYVPPTRTNIGRIAIVADPQTAPFALIGEPTIAGVSLQAAGPEAHAPGRVGWHELLAADGAKAFGFYHELFGWERSNAGHGPVQSYHAFAVDGRTVGGMFTKLAGTPFSFWLYYFDVPDMAHALARLKAARGQVLQGPSALPDGSWIVRCTDPQGAMFALQGPSSEAIEEQAPKLGWSAEWGGFASKGRVVVKPPAKPKR
ncbi:MAG: VOC family protein [Bradyrhizobium sp.]|uniref:VOC family protein n=1 Tax=Bradyrhizobium sp. TaxID=376 RepID=UPI001DCFD684|nr:VOC family protein [Bradyrhizobium sp.]MBV9562346.1 VOC family protein [Bradyrhizobium sp.]